MVNKVPDFSQVICHVNVESKTKVSEITSISIIRFNLVNDHTSLMHMYCHLPIKPDDIYQPVKLMSIPISTLCRRRARSKSVQSSMTLTVYCTVHQQDEAPIWWTGIYISDVWSIITSIFMMEISETLVSKSKLTWIITQQSSVFKSLTRDYHIKHNNTYTGHQIKECWLTVNNTKYFWLFSPTQLFTHGQWWSIFRMHLKQKVEDIIILLLSEPWHSFLIEAIISTFIPQEAHYEK